MLLDSILHKNAADPGCSDKVALICGDNTLNYAQLNQQVNRLGNALMDLGIARGDRVGILGRNSDTYVLIYFALARIGAVAVPINFWYKSQEICYTLKQSGSSALIADGQFAEAIAPAQRQLPGLRWTLYYGQQQVPGSPSLEEVMAAAATANPEVQVDENDPHIILYTSGTTGFPKGATFSHRSHYIHALSLAQTTGGRADDVGLVIYPLFHTGGPDCLLLPHFLLGATLVILDGGDADEILRLTQRHRATNIFCVPTVWRRLLARLRERDYDVSSVRRCLGSSDTFPPDLLDEIMQRFNAEVYVTYGLTEAGCLLTVCRLTHEDRSKLGSVGRPMPIVELALMDQEGRPVPLGEVGQVAARTPGVMNDYWQMPERTAEALREGWLYSGDMGRLDEEGYLYLAGRAKDMIISGGENIYPLEIERLLKENPQIRDAAVVGVPDREWGESVLAVVVPAPGTTLTREAVVDYVRQRLAGYKKPRYVELVDTLPVTTATGKVQKGVLRQRYAEKYGTQ